MSEVGRIPASREASIPAGGKLGTVGQPLRVVAAAYEVVVTTDDPRVVRTIISAPRPARHHNLAGLVHHGQERGLFADEQTVRNSGFLLSDGSYADRQRAADVAIAAGQITRDQMTIKGTLFSEDLW